MLMQRPEFTNKDFSLIYEIVKKECGIKLNSQKKSLIENRISKIIKTESYCSVKEYLSCLVRDNSGKMMTEFLNSMTTNVTNFFREDDHFKFLTNNYIPEMLERKKNNKDNTVRFWSAACSSGQEPYSLAMLIHDKFPKLLDMDYRVLATDIDTTILDKAMKGIYSNEHIENVPQGYINRYFAKLDKSTYQVRPNIKSNVFFRKLNLISSNFPFNKKFDVIFCRNVFIYFDAPTQEKIVNKFYENLHKGGVLLIGHSEGLVGCKHKFKSIGPATYQKL